MGSVSYLATCVMLYGPGSDQAAGWGRRGAGCQTTFRPLLLLLLLLVAVELSALVSLDVMGRTTYPDMLRPFGKAPGTMMAEVSCEGGGGRCTQLGGQVQPVRGCLMVVTGQVALIGVFSATHRV